jgi:hypothetical protein
MFVRSESTEAYSRMFRAVRDRAREFFDIEVSVAYGSLDHSEAIASAFLEHWPRVKLLTCWPHLLRQARAKRSMLSDPDLFESLIKPHLRMLRSARSHEQFVRVGEIVLANWESVGETRYSEWFHGVYMVPRWSRWHINAAEVPGVIPSQQGIESHHNAIKKTCAPSSRASTTGVLEGILPRILKADGETLCPDSVAHHCNGPIPPEMLLKAQRLVSSQRNYRRVHQGRGRRKKLVAVLFNTTMHIDDGANLLASPVDQARSRRFLLSLDGRVPDRISADELRFELLSLHRVRVRATPPTEAFVLSPVWSSATITRVRTMLRCTCESHIRSGWVCSHVLATLSLFGLLDLSSALSRVPVRRAPGRPRARRGGLEIEDDHDGYFDIPKLIRLFLRRPGQPL